MALHKHLVNLLDDLHIFIVTLILHPILNLHLTEELGLIVKGVLVVDVKFDLLLEIAG